MKLKVLEGSYFVGLVRLIEDFEKDDDWYKKTIEPKFNRNGWYLDRESGECWFEVDGRAWQSRRGEFEYELELLDHKPLRAKENAALKLLLYENKLNKEMRDLYYLNHRWFEHREVYRDARARVLSMRKEIAETS